MLIFLHSKLHGEHALEELFKSKGLHFGDYLTQPDTVTTMISMFSGCRPSEMRDTGIGHSHTYAGLSDDDKKIWDDKRT